jgi:signal transduction histidine kinase
VCACGRATTEARRQEYYARITSESDRLSRLVEHLLDFSRMEAGRREYRMERIHTVQWLHGVAAAFQAQRPEGAPEIRVTIPTALPPISADGEALTCAVQNLLDNAVKYSPGRPEVWLEAEAEATGIAIRVRDHGQGIGDDDRAQVFDTFFRGTDDLTRRVKGAGIGLSLVRHIVSAHRGRVECESRVGRGTTFSIHLPALAIEGTSIDAVRVQGTEPGTLRSR